MAAVLRPASWRSIQRKRSLQSWDVHILQPLWITSRRMQVKFSLADTEIIDGVSTGGAGGCNRVLGHLRTEQAVGAGNKTLCGGNCLCFVPFVESGSPAQTTQGRSASASFPPLHCGGGGSSSARPLENGGKVMSSGLSSLKAFACSQFHMRDLMKAVCQDAT